MEGIKGKMTDGTTNIPGTLVKYVNTNMLSFTSDDKSITGTTIENGKLQDSEKYKTYKFVTEDGRTLNEQNKLVKMGGKKSKKSKRKSKNNKRRNNKTKRRK